MKHQLFSLGAAVALSALSAHAVALGAPAQQQQAWARYPALAVDPDAGTLFVANGLVSQYALREANGVAAEGPVWLRSVAIDGPAQTIGVAAPPQALEAQASLTAITPPRLAAASAYTLTVLDTDGLAAPRPVANASWPGLEGPQATVIWASLGDSVVVGTTREDLFRQYFRADLATPPRFSPVFWGLVRTGAAGFASYRDLLVVSSNEIPLGSVASGALRLMDGADLVASRQVAGAAGRVAVRGDLAYVRVYDGRPSNDRRPPTTTIVDLADPEMPIVGEVPLIPLEVIDGDTGIGVDGNKLVVSTFENPLAPDVATTAELAGTGLDVTIIDDRVVAASEANGVVYLEAFRLNPERQLVRLRSPLAVPGLVDPRSLPPRIYLPSAAAHRSGLS